MSILNSIQNTVCFSLLCFSAHSCVSWWDGAGWRRGAAADILGSSKRTQRSLVFYTSLGFSSGEFLHVRDEVAPAFWQIKSCRVTSSVWLYIFVSAFWLSVLCTRSVSFSIWPQETRSSIWTISLTKVHCKVRNMNTFPVSKALYMNTHWWQTPRSFPQAMTCPRSSGGTADISMRKPFPIGWWLWTLPRWREGG